MQSKILLLAGLVASATAQEMVQDLAPDVVILSTTKSGVLPTLPTATPFTGVRTLQGAIVDKGPVDPAYQGLNGPAQVQSSMPSGTYVATLPSVMFNPGTGATISGSISGAANANGTGVNFKIDFSGFPDVAQYGPFVYHIHDLPVPANGNCTETMGHLDPTNRGEYFPCNAPNPSSCQAGDLAGKHGKISASTFSANYVDLYLSTDPSSPYFFGSKSIVLHTSNTTRLTCANFMMSNGTGMMTTSSGTSAASPTEAISGAARMEVGVAAAGLFLAGVLAALM